MIALLRGIIILLWICFSMSILVIPFFLISWILLPWDKTGKFSHWYIRQWSIICLFPVKRKIYGKENILRGRPVIYASNHQGFLDIFLLNTTLHTQYRWVSKKSLFNVPVFGWCMRTAKYIPLVRGDKEDADRMINTCVEKIKSGIGIVIFPEGTWGYPDGTMRSFKRGVAVIAEKSMVPIQPITIIDSNKANPSDSFRFYNIKIKIIIDPPIFPETYKDWSEQQILDNLKNIIQKNIDKYKE